MNERPKSIVGMAALVRTSGDEPPYYTDVHRAHVGATGVVHAIVAAVPRDNPLVKVKFGPDEKIVFFRLSELDVRPPDEPVTHRKHGERTSHLPKM
jgi:hypothetical protein